MAKKVSTPKTRLKPLGDRLVVKPAPREEMTKSGIVLPDTVKERPQEGTVLSVGPGRILDDGSREAIDVSVGQHVEVADAILANDAEAAVAAYRKHLEHVRDTTIQSMALANRQQ